MKADSLPVEEFLIQSSNKLLIDVRAPLEFRKGHIPGAVNIPLFDDLERAEIGTLYKSNGKDDAVMRGLEIVAPKLTEFIKEAKKNSLNNEVYIYCFRGGMRSNSFGWLLNTAGLKVKIMEGGYKAYRNHVLKNFDKDYKLVLLGGATGSGKTEILSFLKKSIPILDLEDLANHKGSAFGGINQPAQSPQQLFENNLSVALEKLPKGKIILVEDESMSIGYNKIPYSFWLKMKAAPIIKIGVPFGLRVKRLVKEYGNADVEALKKSIKNISQQLGPNQFKECNTLLDEGKLEEVAAITLKYYDRAYEFNHTKKNITTIIPVETNTDNAEYNADLIKKIIKDTYGTDEVDTIQ